MQENEPPYQLETNLHPYPGLSAKQTQRATVIAALVKSGRYSEMGVSCKFKAPPEPLSQAIDLIKALEQRGLGRLQSNKNPRQIASQAQKLHDRLWQKLDGNLFLPTKVTKESTLECYTDPDEEWIFLTQTTYPLNPSRISTISPLTSLLAVKQDGTVHIHLQKIDPQNQREETFFVLRAGDDQLSREAYCAFQKTEVIIKQFLKDSRGSWWQYLRSKVASDIRYRTRQGIEIVPRFLPL